MIREIGNAAVDGAVIRAWASMKSFSPKMQKATPHLSPATTRAKSAALLSSRVVEGCNAQADLHGQKRSSDAYCKRIRESLRPGQERRPDLPGPHAVRHRARRRAIHFAPS